MSEFLFRIKAIIVSVLTFIAAIFGLGAGTPKDPAVVTGVSDEEYFEKYFEPVFRFAVASDVHIDDSGSKLEEERLALLYKTAYEYAQNQKYKKLDGVFFAGDISNTGTKSSLEKFFDIVNENCLKGTTTRAVLGNHEFYQGQSNTLSNFLSVSGYETSDADITIGGYHFIFLCPNNSGCGYSESQIEWLDEHIATAVKSDLTGTKPVFVFQHHHVSGTVYGSEDWGVNDLRSVLEKYPQVVDFSGHSHYPINDSRSIWQGSFTALGTGTLSYYEMGIAGVANGGIFPSDEVGSYTSGRNHRDAAQYYIVEISKENSVLIKGYDILSDSFICEYKIRMVGNSEFFDYTDARKNEAASPVFAEESKMETYGVYSNYAVFIVPQASDSEQVQHYRFEAYKDDVKVATSYSLSDTFYFPTPETIYGKLTGLEPDTEYLIKCYAVNCWEKESVPLTINIHTKEESQEKVGCYESPVTPDVFSFVMRDDGLAYDGVSGELLGAFGYPGHITESKTKRTAAVFSGFNFYRFDNFKNYYDSIKSGVTFEYYGNPDAFYSRNGYQYINPLSNMEGGGCGIEISSSGLAQFFVFVNGDYIHPGAKINENEPVHIVGTFDGKNVCVYINGTLQASAEANGEMTFPENETARYLCIGADSGVNGASQGSSAGMLLTANVYSRALSAEEVASLYQVVSGDGSN